MWAVNTFGPCLHGKGPDFQGSDLSPGHVALASRTSAFQKSFHCRYDFIDHYASVSRVAGIRVLRYVTFTAGELTVLPRLQTLPMQKESVVKCSYIIRFTPQINGSEFRTMS